MIRRTLPALLPVLLIAIAPALAQSEAERVLLDQRRAWWRTPDHALDVATLSPVERVRGGAGGPLSRRSGGLDPAAAAAAIAYVSRVPTQSLLVWHAGALVLEHYGPGFGPDARSAPASMPKPVLALAIGAAVARGRMGLDHPIARWLTEWRGDPRGAITVRELLQMRSGLAKDGAATAGGRGEALMLGTRLADTLLATPLAGTPGAVFDYNNVDNGLLALALERATGMRYADWLSRTVWRPIGAADAGVWLDRPGGLARTFCCLLTTARNWVRVGRLINDRGLAGRRRVLPASWIDAMTAPSPTNPNYGFQIWRASPYVPERGYGSGGVPPVPAREPFLAPDMLFFDGAVGQRVYISRAQDLVIVRIGASMPDWDDSVLPNLIVRGLRERGH